MGETTIQRLLEEFERAEKNGRATKPFRRDIKWGGKTHRAAIIRDGKHSFTIKITREKR